MMRTVVRKPGRSLKRPSKSLAANATGLKHYTLAVVTVQKRAFFEQKRYFTSYPHARLELELASFFKSRIGSNYEAACGEAQYYDGTSYRFADLLVTEKNPQMQGAGLAYPPLLLVEIMSTFNIEEGALALQAKLRNAFTPPVHPCLCAWLVYHKRIVPQEKKTWYFGLRWKV